MDHFISSSIDSQHFQVEDVESDNACFYRALANGLAFISKNIDHELEIENESLDFTRPTNCFYGNKNWGYSGDHQEILARELQQLALDWVEGKRDMRAPLPDGSPNITLEELIMMVHDLSYEDYVEQYKYFAGDIIVEKNDDTDEIISVLDDRWGGYVEQIAISQQLKIPIVVLNAQKYDTRLGKIINGRVYRNKPIKGVRFKIYQTSGLEFISRDKPIVYLLWKKTKNGDHYMSLYPENHGHCKKIISEQLQ